LFYFWLSKYVKHVLLGGSEGPVLLGSEKNYYERKKKWKTDSTSTQKPLVSKLLVKLCERLSVGHCLRQNK
jgi:hypothetical protein